MFSCGVSSGDEECPDDDSDLKTTEADIEVLGDAWRAFSLWSFDVLISHGGSPKRDIDNKMAPLNLAGEAKFS